MPAFSQYGYQGDNGQWVRPKTNPGYATGTSPWINPENWGPGRSWDNSGGFFPSQRAALTQTQMVTDAIKGLFGGLSGGSSRGGATAGTGTAGGGGSSPGQIGGFNFLDAGGNRVGGVDLGSGNIQSPIQANPGSLWSKGFADQARSDLMRPAAAGVGGTGNFARIGGQYGDMATGLANRAASGLDIAGNAAEADYFNQAQGARGQSQLGAQQLLNRMFSGYRQDDLAGANLGLRQAGINVNDQLNTLTLLSKLLGGMGGLL